jgi:very-long-chain enoyl-CoA reductase
LINVGPVISFSLFWAYRLDIYTFCLGELEAGKADLNGVFVPSLAQDIAIKMVLCHFMKRILECIFVHFYSKPTKSLSSIVREMGYFWLSFGVVVPFYLFHPYYKPDGLWTHVLYLPTGSLNYIYHFLTAVFGLVEMMNLLCHIHLKSLRKGDLDTTRGIPRIHGFQAVSCANYFWELLAWVTFALIAQTLASFLFLTACFFRMNYRAHKKHHRYIAQFKNLYPADERFYFIPYLF